jgi:hypothetical protein
MASCGVRWKHGPFLWQQVRARFGPARGAVGKCIHRRQVPRLRPARLGRPTQLQAVSGARSPRVVSAAWAL